MQYSVPVIKYNRNGLKPRPRQLILTQTAAYVVEQAKIKQRVLYTFLKGQDSLVNVRPAATFLHYMLVCVCVCSLQAFQSAT